MCDSVNLDVAQCPLPLRDLDKLALNLKIATIFPPDIWEPHTLLVQPFLCCGASTPKYTDSSWCTVSSEKFSHTWIPTSPMKVSASRHAWRAPRSITQYPVPIPRNFLAALPSFSPFGVPFQSSHSGLINVLSAHHPLHGRSQAPKINAFFFFW